MYYKLLETDARAKAEYNKLHKELAATRLKAKKDKKDKKWARFLSSRWFWSLLLCAGVW